MSIYLLAKAVYFLDEDPIEVTRPDMGWSYRNEEFKKDDALVVDSDGHWYASRDRRSFLSAPRRIHDEWPDVNKDGLIELYRDYWVYLSPSSDSPYMQSLLGAKRTLFLGCTSSEPVV